MDQSKILTNLNIDALNQMQLDTATAFEKTNNIVLISPTGSGKTLAFLLPILKLLNSNRIDVQTLILVPTRELAQQIEQVFKRLGSGFKISCCYGGHAVQIEKNNLAEPPAVLVGTPGRIAHHIRKKNLDLRTTNILVLDEFDKSLEAGFHEEMSFIIKSIQQLQKKILTSATLLNEIPDFVGLKNPLVLNFTNGEQGIKSALKIKSVRAIGFDKLEALMLLIGKIGSGSSIVFCNHRDAVDRISTQLTRLKIEHGFYHGGLEQINREKTLIKLRNGSINLLISTDLAARGLDIPEIDTVIHYQLPLTEDSMVHRNGRTARMNAGGTAYFLLEQEDYLPKFITETVEEETLPEKMILPKVAAWSTLYISAGKKDKINKMDLVGMLLQKGNLQKNDLGKIEVLDYSAYVAVRRTEIVNVLKRIKDERIKNKKVKMEISS
jgi:superfamily II DNA/RNA helicase